MNTVSPVLYGNELRISVAGWREHIADGLIGSWLPLWMVEKNRMGYAGSGTNELYPSDSLLAAIYAENHLEERQTDDGAEEVQAVNAPVASSQGITYTVDKLKDYNYFVSQFYAIDSTTYASDGLLDAEKFIDMDLTMDLTGNEPKILIYHTHSQEAFVDSRSGEAADTVVGVGEVLKKNLEERYGISTVHLTDTFDVVDGVTDRSAAYTYAEEGVRAVLEEYPSIKVIIDIHRDGVADETRLVTPINGRDTAQIMFLNGLCRRQQMGR